MRVKMMIAAMAVATMLAGAAQAQTAPDQPQYQAALERMIAETVQGRCPEDVMAAELLAACTPQVAQMSQALQSLGAVESITYLGHETGADGSRLERFAIRYAAGVTLNWGIGGFADGKFSIAFAQNG